MCCVPFLCDGILSQITVEGYEKLSLANWMEYVVQGELPMLLGLIRRDKNGIEDITFTLAGGTIDDFAIDNERA